MQKLSPLLVLLLIAGCAPPSEEGIELVERHPPQPAPPTMAERISLPPVTRVCQYPCPRTPDFEPVGQICRLTGGVCINGITHCYYHCEPIDD